MKTVAVFTLLLSLSMGESDPPGTCEVKLKMEPHEFIRTTLATQQAQLTRIEEKLDALLNKHDPRQHEDKCFSADNDQLGQEKYPANSCKQIIEECEETGGRRIENGLYWIKTSLGGAAVQTYCDMTRGGWTLVGKIGGSVGNIYDTWLVANHNVESLKTPRVHGNNQYGSINARPLAVKFASQIMLSSGENDNGVGSRWVSWTLPDGRDLDTFWRHSVGQSAVMASSQDPVTVTSWNDQTHDCYQNRYGIMPLPQHGGSYPSVTFNTLGNTNVGDICMAVGVQTTGTNAHGWSQNGNGYDSAKSDDDWPNSSYNHQTPFIAVWLK